MAELDGGAPRVSTIIPCYNGERFIGEAIESVLGQTYRDLEVVVVDDGSTDGSMEVVGSYLGDGRVRIVRHEANRGIPAARNTGIESSAGEFVSFLDQDDTWVPGKLEAQVPMLEVGGPERGLVFSDVVMMDDSGVALGLAQGREIPRGIGDMSRRDVLRALYLRNFIPLISVLVRRTCLVDVGGFDESICGGMDDYELCLRIVPDWDIARVEEPLAVHRVHEDSYSKNTERLISDAAGVMGRLVQKHPFLMDLRPRREARYHVALSRHHRDTGNAAAARKELRRAIASDPSWLKLYAAYALLLSGNAGRRLLAARRRLRRPGAGADIGAAPSADRGGRSPSNEDDSRR